MAEIVTHKRTARLWRILLKTLVLFLIFQVAYYVLQPMNWLNHLTIYNVLVPRRSRFAFSDYPIVSYNLSIANLDQMLVSHEIAKPKAPDEYRVIMLGDSSIWGYLLQPDQTQAACLNQMALSVPSGRKLRVYNLGYPKLSVVKDLLILRHALTYQPDLVIWSTSLASLYPSDQLDFAIVRAQYDEVATLVDQYKFKLDQWPLSTPTWFDRTFFGQRRELADWLRYQLYGPDWAATGIDHLIPKFVTPNMSSLNPDDNVVSVGVLHLATPHQITPSDISLDVVKAGIQIAASQGVSVLLVNEPIARPGSDLRWNYYYPRWAYDGYRQAMTATAQREGWQYVDFWDAEPTDQFTDTDFHLNAHAICEFAAKLSVPLLALADQH